MSNHSIRWVNQNGKYDNQAVLFIGRPNGQFAQNLYKAFSRCGQLSMSLHGNSRLISREMLYDCYILDADYLGDVGTTMNKILAVQPKARILVISNTYDWEDARYVFRLGAIDVIRPPQSSMLIRETINYVSAKQLPRQASRPAGV